MKRGLKIALYSLSVIIIIIVSAGVWLNNVASPSKLTPIVNSIIKENIIGDVTIKSIDLRVFRSFPYMSIMADSVSVEYKNQPIMSASQFELRMLPWEYVFKRKIDIDKITISNPNINIVIDKQGITNVEALIPQTDTTITDTTVIDTTIIDTTITDTTTVDSTDRRGGSYNIKEIASGISIRDVIIQNGTISFVDSTTNNVLKASGINMNFKGGVSDKGMGFATSIYSDGIYFASNDKTLIDNISIGLESRIRMSRKPFSVKISNSKLILSNIELSLEGELTGDKEKRELITDLSFNLSTPTLAPLAQAIPSTLIPADQKFSTDGEVILNGKIQGRYGKNIMPALEAEMSIDNAKLKYDSMKFGIDKLNLASSIKIDPMDQKASFVDINKFQMISEAGIDISGSAKISNPLHGWTTNFKLLSNTNLDMITQVFPMVEGVVIKGINKTDIEGSFTKKDIETENYGDIYLNGTSSFKDMLLTVDGALFKMPDSTSTTTTQIDTIAKDSNNQAGFLFIEMKTGEFKFGSGIKANEGSKAKLSAEVNFSDVGFKDKFGKELYMSNVSLAATTGLAAINDIIKPVDATLKLGNIKITLPDTLTTTLASTEVGFSLRAKGKNRDVPFFDIKINSDSLVYDIIHAKTNGELKSAYASFTTVRDTTVRHGRDLVGELNFKGFKAFSELFPLQISMSNSNVAFSGTTLELKKAQLRVGRSSLVMTGSVNNIISRMLGANEDDVDVNMDISSKRININQLMAASAGFTLADDVDTLSHDDMELLSFPDYLNATINLNANSLLYAKSSVTDLNGVVTIKNGDLSLDALNFVAAKAKMDITAKYKVKSDSTGWLKMSLNSPKTDVSELVKFLPMLDSIMPHMKGISGVVDLEMAAVSDIKKDMTLDMPSLESVISIEGTELVLLDGETFAEIADMLKFKRKDRNVIDTLGLNAVIHKNGVINVPPFEISMDRYRAIIGGTQTVDYETFNIDYKYNISIIKSPLLIKAGLDITGNQDDYDFKITKAKLKKSDFDIIQQNIDSLRTELIKNEKL